MAYPGPGPGFLRDYYHGWIECEVTVPHHPGRTIGLVILPDLSIEGVDPHSELARNGVEAGMVVVGVDRVPVASDEDTLEKVARAPGPMLTLNVLVNPDDAAPAEIATAHASPARAAPHDPHVSPPRPPRAAPPPPAQPPQHASPIRTPVPHQVGGSPQWVQAQPLQAYPGGYAHTSRPPPPPVAHPHTGMPHYSVPQVHMQSVAITSPSTFAPRPLASFPSAPLSYPSAVPSPRAGRRIPSPTAARGGGGWAAASPPQRAPIRLPPKSSFEPGAGNPAASVWQSARRSAAAAPSTRTSSPFHLSNAPSTDGLWSEPPPSRLPPANPPQSAGPSAAASVDGARRGTQPQIPSAVSLFEFESTTFTDCEDPSKHHSPRRGGAPRSHDVDPRQAASHAWTEAGHSTARPHRSRLDEARALRDERRTSGAPPPPVPPKRRSRPKPDTPPPTGSAYSAAMQQLLGDDAAFDSDDAAVLAAAAASVAPLSLSPALTQRAAFPSQSVSAFPHHMPSPSQRGSLSPTSPNTPPPASAGGHTNRFAGTTWQPSTPLGARPYLPDHDAPLTPPGAAAPRRPGWDRSPSQKTHPPPTPPAEEAAYSHHAPPQRRAMSPPRVPEHNNAHGDAVLREPVSPGPPRGGGRPELTGRPQSGRSAYPPERAYGSAFAQERLSLGPTPGGGWQEEPPPAADAPTSPDSGWPQSGRPDSPTGMLPVPAGPSRSASPDSGWPQSGRSVGRGPPSGGWLGASQVQTWPVPSAVTDPQPSALGAPPPSTAALGSHTTHYTPFNMAPGRPDSPTGMLPVPAGPSRSASASDGPRPGPALPPSAEDAPLRAKPGKPAVKEQPLETLLPPKKAATPRASPRASPRAAASSGPRQFLRKRSGKTGQLSHIGDEHVQAQVRRRTRSGGASPAASPTRPPPQQQQQQQPQPQRAASPPGRYRGQPLPEAAAASRAGGGGESGVLLDIPAASSAVLGMMVGPAPAAPQPQHTHAHAYIPSASAAAWN
eukprot:TRINITY_DN3164_c0_g1_i2.p1 TRINITY_DN3164_c0_g1~~TRINITY_DN3164_c0_g1_i2.p1  ORF type:complete len:1000 (+),score=184.87 TRINITY_DN3164_c0_g1_i2:40-3039(+)